MDLYQNTNIHSPPTKAHIFFVRFLILPISFSYKRLIFFTKLFLMKIASLSLSLAYIANYPSHTKADGEEVLHLRIREHATSTKQPVAAEVNDVDLGPIVADVINGDDVTSRDRYPWMAQIPYSSGSHCCGGSLVAPDFVLCAAHCQGCSTNGEAIRIGPRDLNSAQGEEIPIANKFIHPQYNSGALDYDYMLWQLQSSSTYDPVAINPSSSVPANFGDEIHVIGWGELENGGSTAILQEAMVPYQDCADSNYAFTDRMMCAEFTGSPIRDACVGDSGGPLFMKGVDATEDMQVGIVSWGDYPCDREGEYGVYARVSAEFAWIQETICDNSNADLSRTNLNCGSTPVRLICPGFLHCYILCNVTQN